MEQEDEEENNLDKSDHNVSPDTSGGDEVIEPHPPPPKYNKEKPVNRPFPCQKCRETFINKQFLKAHTCSKHESEHSEVEDTFECEQCDFSSTYKANLQRHQEKLHKKRKAVTQGPPNSKKKLIFKCDDCDNKSAYKLNVKKHMTRIH